MSADLVNGIMNTAVGLLVLNNVRVLRAHRCVKGVSLLSNCVFYVMGVWNLFYYVALEQPWSLAGAGIIVSANTVWWTHVWNYRREA